MKLERRLTFAKVTWTLIIVLLTELIQLLTRREQRRARSVCIYYPLSLRRGADLKAMEQVCFTSVSTTVLLNGDIFAIWRSDIFFDNMIDTTELS